MAGQISATQQADLIGGPMVPILAATIYGVYRLFKVGFHGDHATLPFALMLGGLASLVCLPAYVGVSFSPPGRSWGKTVATLSVFVPYLYGLVMIGGLGLWGGWLAISKHLGMWHVVLAVVWFFAGWLVLNKLAAIQTVARSSSVIRS